MRKKWTKRALVLAVVGGMFLVMSVRLGLAQPEIPADVTSDHPEGAALPASDGPIGAQTAPSVSIVAPSAAMGDFGASQGNVWDMNSTNDIVWTQYNASGQTIQLSQLSAGIVRGRIPERSALAIAFYASSSTNLPSKQYHHLLYRLKIAAEGTCRTNGRIVYTKAWPNWLGTQVSSLPIRPHAPPMTDKGCDYGKFCTYYIDLSSNSDDRDGGAIWRTDPSPWPTDGVKAFGLWPHEWWVNCDGGPDYFDLDYVYLTGDIVAREKDGYHYTAKWYVSDPDGGTIVSTIRYQAIAELQLPSNSPTCDSTSFNNGTWKDFSPVAQETMNLTPSPSYPNRIYLPIIAGGASGGMGPFNESHTLDFSDNSKFSDGTSYYLCIRVNDGASQRYAVSSAPVIRVPLISDFADHD